MSLSKEDVSKILEGMAKRRVGCKRWASNDKEGAAWWAEQDVPLTGDLSKQLQEIDNVLLAKVAAFQQYDKRSSSETKPQAPKTDQPWIQSKKSPDVEFIPVDRPEAQQFVELAKANKDGYWLSQDGKLIFRRKPK